MEIKATSIYNLKTTQALMRLNMFKKADPKKRMRVEAIIATVLLALTIFDLIAFERSPSIWMMLGVLIVGTLLHSYMYFWLPKIRYKSSGKFADIQNTFIFRENEMSISSSIDNYTGSSSLKYTMLFKVMETNDYFFLFQNKLHEYVVDKSTIEGGTADGIRRVLMDVLKTQYIICNY